jgi:hypothetical protein
VSGALSYAGRPGRHAHRLTTQEKDVLLVLTAFCKLASREVPGGVAGSDSVLAQGKLLALEMLAKVCLLLCVELLFAGCEAFAQVLLKCPHCRVAKIRTTCWT